MREAEQPYIRIASFLFLVLHSLPLVGGNFERWVTVPTTLDRTSPPRRRKPYCSFKVGQDAPRETARRKGRGAFAGIRIGCRGSPWRPGHLVCTNPPSTPHSRILFSRRPGELLSHLHLEKEGSLLSRKGVATRTPEPPSETNIIGIYPTSAWGVRKTCLFASSLLTGASPPRPSPPPPSRFSNFSPSMKFRAIY